MKRGLAAAFEVDDPLAAEERREATAAAARYEELDAWLAAATARAAVLERRYSAAVEEIDQVRGRIALLQRMETGATLQ